jgi:uncharacterized repeat protein (TIGR03803 family)
MVSYSRVADGRRGWRGSQATPSVFTGEANGDGPGADLIHDADGNIFGTTQYGGSGENGVVFELTPLR